MRRKLSSLGPGRLLVIFLGVLLFNCLYIAVARRLPDPPWQFFSAVFFMGNIAIHLLLGCASVALFIWLGRHWGRAIRETTGLAKALGGISALGLGISLLAGLALFVFGNLHPQAPILAVHGGAALVSIVCGGLWLVGRAAGGQAVFAPALTRAAVALIAVFLLPGAGLLWLASHQVSVASKILNPEITPASMEEEGEGPSGPYWPSSVRKVHGGKFFPSEYFTDSKSCGEPGCHPDIYKQWNSSAHHLSSFNNQWYRKSIEYMQEVVGTQPSKWCGGCHDMAISLTEMPGTGKSRFEFPIKDQIYPPEQHPEAHAGIGCAVCHSVVHIDSTMGNGDYLAGYPPMHQFVISKNPFLRAATKFLTRLAPEPHRKTFLKPFHTMDTAKFCSACHKVHLDVPVNHYRWFRGFNDYDAWQASGVSGFGARSFYYPKKQDGTADFKKCADCHMPLTASGDAGNIGGFVHSHRFPAANTALPWANHDTEQLNITQKFLKDGALSIDIFALRREKGGAAKIENRKSKTGNSAAPEGQSASLMGDVATTGNAGAIASANTAAVNEDVIAPLNRGPVAVKRGEDALIDVVVRTKKVGHAFPGGTFDAFDVWVELEAKDETGKVLFWSGCLDSPGGPVEKSAHKYQALLVDEHSNPINKRNAWAARAKVYARAIPPGAADTIHYRLHIPKDCGKQITLTARLNYRKFTWWNTQFAFRGRPRTDDPAYSKGGLIQGTRVGYDANGAKASGPVSHGWDDRPMLFDADMKVAAAKDRSAVPSIPITSLCENTVTLNVCDGDPIKATAPRAVDPEKDRERWNDYGIGLMLQGDFLRATKAFKMVTKVAPKWPEGYVNIGRVRLQEGDLREARGQFEQAFKLYDAKPTPMTPYQRARTQFFYGMVLKQQNGDYDGALKAWRECAAVFPKDRELRNQMGRVLFLQRKFNEAIAEFREVLDIDPEDLTAHYNLMLCYKGIGNNDMFEKHQHLYYRFKNDETTTHIAGPYLNTHPEDNNESLSIHEHGSARLKPATSPPTKPQIAGKQKPVRISRR